VHANVGVAARQNTEVSVVALQPADAFGPIEIQRIAVATSNHHRTRQIRFKALTDNDRPSPGPTRSVGRRKRLVHIDVETVKAHLRRPHHAENRVQIGAVAVHQAPGFMDRLSYLP
jgi:hypothetical protein